MIISDKYKYVYVSIPKTGTLSVRTWLRKYYEGIPLNRHRYPQLSPGAGYHSCFVPDQCKDYLIFTTVRNPYARCYSGYKFEQYGGTFLKYLKILPTRRNTGHLKMFYTQTYFVEMSGATHIIKLENIEEILTLPFIDKPVMPEHLRSRTNIVPPYTDYYGEEEHQALLKYCEEDFERFGYDKIY